MDSPVALAVMAKAQVVFGTDDVFLSFPIVPQPFSNDQLSFVSGGTVSKESLNGLAAFAYMVNQVPGQPVWLPTGSPFLWNVYGDTLQSAQLAQSSRTAEEEAEYQAAFKFLHIVHEDGTWEDTAQVKTYNQYRDASLALQQDYNNRKVAADLSSDPTVKQQWLDVDEPALRAKIQALLDDWTTKGYKIQVEDEESTYARLGAKSPNLIWSQWQSQFNPNIDALTDPNGELVFVTGFSPSNAIDVPTWQRFTLTGDEVSALIAQAPDELRKRLAPDAVDLEIDSLSFEYISVLVTRPWLQNEIFNARFWRFKSGTELLSDGQTTAGGSFPAYVVSVVFAKNIEVRLKAQSAVNDKALQRLQSAKGLSLGSFTLAPSAELTATLKQPVLLSHQPILEAEAIRPSVIEAARPDGLVTPPVIAHPIVPINDRLSMTTVIGHPIVPDTGEISPTLSLQSNRVSTLLKGTDFERFPPIHWGPPPPPPPPPPPVEIDNSIYVMAFICKSLPLCPNPDLTLQW